MPAKTPDSPTQPPAEYFTVPTMAEELRREPSTIYRMLDRLGIEPEATAGKLRLYTSTTIEALRKEVARTDELLPRKQRTTAGDPA